MTALIKLQKPKYGPLVTRYKETFGHAPSAEDQKFRTAEELEVLAGEALELGEPIEDWKDRPDRKTGTVTDGWYKIIEENERNQKRETLKRSLPE